MATTTPRRSVNLDAKTLAILDQMAKADQRSFANFAGIILKNYVSELCAEELKEPAGEYHISKSGALPLVNVVEKFGKTALAISPTVKPSPAPRK